MSERKAPALAVGLLEYFAIPTRNEALMGDLNEEFQHGRSACWFWKQTVVAVFRNGQFAPGFRFASFVGWALQLIAVLFLWRYTNLPWMVTVPFGLVLILLQHRGRRLLAGSTKWRDIQCLLRRVDGPFNYRGIPLWSLIACDEFVDYLVTYLFLTASAGRFNIRPLLFCEILWLIAHFVAAHVTQKRRRA